MDLELAGRRAVITGASKGIGLGVAEAFAAEGIDLVLVARSGDKLARAATDLATRHGVEVETFAADLSQSTEQQRLADHLADGPLDIVINNAGAIPGGWLSDIDEETWRHAWDLKVFGYINLTRLLQPQLERHAGDVGRTGVLLNIIGAAADRPSPGYIAGAAGNSALDAMTRAIGSRSLRRGVRVLGVNPGLIITDRLTDLLRQRAETELGDTSRWRELIPTDPAPGTVAQVADVVTFLVSDRAGHVSGTMVTIDGGSSAR